MGLCAVEVDLLVYADLLRATTSNGNCLVHHDACKFFAKVLEPANCEKKENTFCTNTIRCS